MADNVMKADTNGCLYKMVNHCYYQDTSKQLNPATCTNCILARVERHLFSLTTKTPKPTKPAYSVNDPQG
jgi:hypothetical protein